jgi:hypothetical protein
MGNILVLFSFSIILIFIKKGRFLIKGNAIYVGFEVLTAVVMKSTPCGSPAVTLVYCSAISSTLKLEMICSCETSVDFQRATRRYIPEYGTIQYAI